MFNPHQSENHTSLRLPALVACILDTYQSSELVKLFVQFQIVVYILVFRLNQNFSSPLYTSILTSLQTQSKIFLFFQIVVYILVFRLGQKFFFTFKQQYTYQSSDLIKIFPHSYILVYLLVFRLSQKFFFTFKRQYTYQSSDKFFFTLIIYYTRYILGTIH